MNLSVKGSGLDSHEESVPIDESDSLEKFGFAGTVVCVLYGAGLADNGLSDQGLVRRREIVYCRPTQGLAIDRASFDGFHIESSDPIAD
jgi:hypothetical protein